MTRLFPTVLWTFWLGRWEELKDKFRKAVIWHMEICEQLRTWVFWRLPCSNQTEELTCFTYLASSENDLHFYRSHERNLLSSKQEAENNLQFTKTWSLILGKQFSWKMLLIDIRLFWDECIKTLYLRNYAGYRTRTFEKML